MSPEPVIIGGGGLSGLAAALTLAHAGREVVVYERGVACGSQRHGDAEGLETWIFAQRPMAYLQAHNLPTSFDSRPVATFQYIDEVGQVHSTTAQQPFFHLVRRGAESGCIDREFQVAAEAVGVTFRFQTVRRPHQVHIFAGGPRRACAYVQGMTFRTSAPDGVTLLLGRSYAPQGYAYCITWNGRGTVAAAYTKQPSGTDRVFLRAVDHFRDVLGFHMEDTVSFGFFGAYAPVPTLTDSGALLVGEAAGFQDALFGFGMNFALRSGVLAARAIIDGKDYRRLCRAQLMGPLASCWVNRRLFENLREPVRSRLAARIVGQGRAWEVLHRVSQPTVSKRLMAWWSGRRRTK
ncbi:MAG: NAD(P)-binding protein [Candidatus Marinimicrobia bacterium]|nr:NAD(P)-binding protein [Candidatus Neomarinimicrobiota bacterium]